MSVHQPTASDALKRTSGLASVASDYTACFWFRLTTSISAPYATYFVIGDDLASDYTNYIWIGSDLASNSIAMEVYASGVPSTPFTTGNTSNSPGNYPATVGTWYHVAYVRSGSNHKLFVNGVQHGNTLVEDISGGTFTEMWLGNDSLGGGPGGLEFSHFREWTAALSGAELTAEMGSPTPVRTSNLFTNTPLPSASDVDDTVTTHDWTVIGSLTTPGGGPMVTHLACITRGNDIGFFPTAKGTWNTNPSNYQWLSPTLHKDFGWGSTPQSDFTTTSPQSKGIFIYTSRPLQGTDTLSGEMDAILVVSESDAAADMYFKVHAWVSVGNTNVVRGTLINNYEENTTNEWPTTPTALKFQAPLTLNPVAWQEGDRIIIEVGWIARNVVSTSYVGKIYRGVCGYDDPYPFLSPAAVGETFTGTGATDLKYGTFHFSQAIPFLEEPLIPEPPANDRCSTAIVVSAVPYTSPVINAFEADQGDVLEATCGSAFDRAAIWWKWTPSVSEDATFDALLSDEQPIISIWTGTCGSLTEVACDNTDWSVTIPVTSGTTYYIQFAANGTNHLGTAMQLRVSTASAGLTLTAGTAFITGRTETSITVSSAVIEGGTEPYTYQWHRSLTPGFTPDGTTVLAGGTTVPFTDSTISLGTTYYYKLVVTDAVAATATSTEVEASVNLPATPVVTASIFVPADHDLVNPTKLTIAWTHDDVNTTSFTVEKCTGVGCTDFVAVTSVSVPTHEVTVGPSGYAEGTTYRFRVRANGDISSPWAIVQYKTGITGTLELTDNNGGGGWYWPSASVESGGKDQWNMVSFSPPALAPNQIVRYVTLDLCGHKDLATPGSLDQGGLLYPVGIPIPFLTPDYTSAPTPYSLNPHNEGESGAECIHELGGFSDGLLVSIWNGGSGQELPQIANKLDPAASQADLNARKYGWVGLRFNNNLPGFPPDIFNGVTVTSFKIMVHYVTIGDDLPVLEPPPQDSTTPCCETTTPGTVAPPAAPPPDNPIQPGVIDECSGLGLGPTGTNPEAGELWIY